MKQMLFVAILAAFLLTNDLTRAAGPSQPLPPLKTVLAQIVTRAQRETENDREFQNRYAYKRIKVTEQRNSNGELKRHEEKSSQNNPRLESAALHRSSAESDLKRNSEVAHAGADLNKKTGARGRALEKSDFLLNLDIVDRFNFRLVGREILQGRSALVLDFQPANKNLPVRNYKDRFINKAAGRIWVDELEAALMRADLYLTEKVNVVGGLIGAVTEFTYAFDRERTPDGLWFTRGVQWHLEGREVFAQKVIDYHEEKREICQVDARRSDASSSPPTP